MSKRKSAATTDAYLTSLSEEKRATLEQLRKAIKAAAPRAEECISYGMPAFRLEGEVLVWFGAAAKHCAIYPGAHPIRMLQAELEGYDTSKGTIRFPASKPLPASLVRKLVRRRMAERGRKKPGAARA